MSHGQMHIQITTIRVNRNLVFHRRKGAMHSCLILGRL